MVLDSFGVWGSWIIPLILERVASKELLNPCFWVENLRMAYFVVNVSVVDMVIVCSCGFN